jgi:hypothetical protein
MQLEDLANIFLIFMSIIVVIGVLVVVLLCIGLKYTRDARMFYAEQLSDVMYYLRFVHLVACQSTG